MSEFKPYANFILLDNIVEELKTESGFSITGKEAEKFIVSQADVVSVGPDVKGVASGHRIFYRKGRSFKIVTTLRASSLISWFILFMIL
jgi:co-chaperonin GroES (HSP10)